MQLVRERLPKTASERRKYTPEYLDRLARSRAFLDVWLTANGRSTKGDNDPTSVDDTLVEFVEACARSGQPLYIPRHAILSVQWERRELRYRLGRSWEGLQGMQNERIWSPHVPMPYEAMLATFFSWDWG